jgi:hypothetical protein
VDGKIKLYISESLVHGLGTQRIIPAPLATEVGEGGLTYTFLASKSPASVDLALEPSGPGIYEFTIGVAGAQPVHAMVRVLSRRPGGQLTLFEFVIVFLIGGVIILSTVGKDRSITNCATAILNVGLLHWGVSAIKSKFPRFGAVADGTPLTLLKNGEWQVRSDERHED